MKNKVLILYDYFDPAYKAGGPIRSLVNLVKLMEEEVDFHILTSNQDHDGSILEVEEDKWINYATSSKALYLSKANRGYASIKKELLELKPDVVYLNGMYSLPLMVYPLLILRKWKDIKIAISPRGMLQEGALKIKPVKKKIYLLLLNFLISLQSNIKWHATDKQEFQDIQQFTSKFPIQIAGNIPAFERSVDLIDHGVDRSHFVSISLLATKKNHIPFIRELKELKSKDEISYHIFGPISDRAYYESVLNEIVDLPEHLKIEYKGVLHPSEVSDTLKKYKFYVLTSFGENFGHSIFEAFNQGIPVIIGDQTPWRGLEGLKAGWDVDLQEADALGHAIDKALNMDDETYHAFRMGARKLAVAYMIENDFVKDYKMLFGF